MSKQYTYIEKNTRLHHAANGVEKPVKGPLWEGQLFWHRLQLEESG